MEMHQAVSELISEASTTTEPSRKILLLVAAGDTMKHRGFTWQEVNSTRVDIMRIAQSTITERGSKPQMVQSHNLVLTVLDRFPR